MKSPNADPNDVSLPVQESLLSLWFQFPRLLMSDPSAWIQRVSEKKSLKGWLLLLAVTSAPIAYLLIRFVSRGVVFNYPADILLSIVTFALGTFLHVLCVDMACDFRIRKKKMAVSMNALLGISSWFNVVSAACFVAGVVLFPKNIFLATSLTLLIWWAQWVVEAVVLRHLYAVHFLRIFLLEMVSRVVTAIVAVMAAAVITGMWHEWIDLVA